jgi:hypothetical protein
LQGYSANRLLVEQVAPRLLEILAPELEVPADPNARFAACREAMRQGNYMIVLHNASTAARSESCYPALATRWC